MDVGRQAIRLIQRPTRTKRTTSLRRRSCSIRRHGKSGSVRYSVPFPLFEGMLTTSGSPFKQDHAVGFNHGVQRERGPAFALAQVAMTTVNEQAACWSSDSAGTAGTVALPRRSLHRQPSGFISLQAARPPCRLGR